MKFFFSLICCCLIGGYAHASFMEPKGKGLALYSYAPVVEQAAPAVVNIYTEKVVKGVERLFPGLLGEFLGERPVRQLQKSLGSGVIVRADGIVVTNAHVVKGASKVRVVLQTEEEYEAEIIVVDTRVDLAALRLKSKNKETFPYLDVAPYDELKVGDVVLAIGCPRGLRHSVTKGIISGLGRTEVRPNDFRHLVQVDTDLAGGSSGGALVIMTDKGPMLAAIATAILTDFQGAPTGFGIPGIFIKRILRAVDNDGKLEPTFDGISAQNISEKIRKALKISFKYGILVNAVYPDSPAAKAGIQRGDLILSVDNYPIKNLASLQFRLSILEPEKIAEYVVWRKGEKLTLLLRLDKIPANTAKPELVTSGGFLNGILIQELAPALNYELERDILDKGVIIVDIEANSRAYMMGFRIFDIIRKINDEPIHSLSDFRRALRSSINTLEIQRENQVIYLRVG